MSCVVKQHLGVFFVAAALLLYAGVMSEKCLCQITGNLVKSKLKVAEQYIHILPMNTQVSVEGVSVVLLDANQ